VEESVLTDDLLRQLMNVGEVDILVGLPTYNNAKTVVPVIQAIQAGLLKSYPRERAAIINPDGGSNDGTPERVAEASISDVRHAANLYALRTLHSISTQYSRTPSTGMALRTILAAADLLRAKACAVVSPESSNLEPEWVELLLRPTYRENYDFVAPTYRRHKYEGLLIKNLVYPMTRALYARDVREPYASEFGFSGRLGSQFLGEEVWKHEVGRTGAEISLTLTAITSGYRICQTFLGTKVHADRSAADLVAAMRQTVGALFWSLEANFPIWSNSSEVQPVPTRGKPSEVTLEPVRGNRKELREMFCSGVVELESVLKSILSESTMAALQQAAKLREEDFRYSEELWAKTVYEFAASYHRSVINRDHIIQALVPLYRGRMFTFLTDNRNASAEDVENNVDIVCREFERLKPYLRERWDGGK